MIPRALLWAGAFSLSGFFINNQFNGNKPEGLKAPAHGNAMGKLKNMIKALKVRKPIKQ